MSTPHFPLLIEPETLALYHDLDDMLIVDISRANSYSLAHIPQAVYMEYGDLVLKSPPVGGFLPNIRHLNHLFSSIGLTSTTHVIAYDDEGGGKAGRLIWTLHLLGHDLCSLLNGGIHAWANERHPLDRRPTLPSESDYSAKIEWPEGLVDAEYVLKNLGNPNITLVDARTPPEYSGERKFSKRGGHIPGAVNLDWTLTLDRARNLRWLPKEELRAMFEKIGVSPDREIIVYCQTHHRSSQLYMVLKYLGYPNVRGYAGSWSEWGNLMGVPVVEGINPT
uniref:Sulfurtransferase n=1 Tax=Candidatus Kentrum sp. TC TaxID=2126339 RepID=A0A450ZVI0_9GAMM|nr:MAG: thiosulfate/3-mercaptopyruvate sulfurtransferase [Candidatus Kentron sp. TC]VFK43657.1 MAG: thiosulfate/3-mercaptopyruvate sulfurtransferase [Candidatus Kentron sp. TC]VFK57809.1 MAG: thiosulfate/3-mercaptopyruvate sulfurtransferase [Candidatus Kentron sp. TC]